MSDKTNGGPAFPTEYVKHKPHEVGNYVAITEHSSGMTMRDYFAAKAMQSLLLDYAAAIREGVAAPRDDWMETSATAAYQAADAMLAARGEA